MKQQTQHEDPFIKPNEPVEVDEYISFLEEQGEELAGEYNKSKNKE